MGFGALEMHLLLELLLLPITRRAEWSRLLLREKLKFLIAKLASKHIIIIGFVAELRGSVEVEVAVCVNTVLNVHRNRTAY